MKLLIRFNFYLFPFLWQPRFQFPNEDEGRYWTIRAIGNRWRDYRGRLYNKHYDTSLTKEQNVVSNCPKGVSQDQWIGLINIRDDEKHKVITLYFIYIYLIVYVLVSNIKFQFALV